MAILHKISLFALFLSLPVATFGQAIQPLSPDDVTMKSEQWTLPCGLNAVWLNDDSKDGLVYIRLTFKYGSADSLKGQRAAAELLPAMLGGTKGMTQSQARMLFLRYRASVSYSGEPGTLTLRIEANKRNIDSVMREIGLVLTKPVFHEADFKKTVGQYLTSYRRQPAQREVQSIALRALRDLAPDHPMYSPPLSELATMFQSVSLEDIQTLYDQQIDGSHGSLVIIGNVNAKKVASKVNSIAEELKSDVAYEAIHIDRPQRNRIVTQQIETQEPLENFVAGLVIPINDQHKDYPAVLVAEQILGGSGRPRPKLYETAAKAAPHAEVSTLLQQEPGSESLELILQGFTLSGSVNKVMASVRQELVDIASNGVQNSDLKTAISKYLKRQQRNRTIGDGVDEFSRSSNVERLAKQLEENNVAGRTFEFQAKLEQAVQTMTKERVDAAFRKYVDPMKLHWAFSSRK